jgi:hypothetical protein
VTLNLHKLSPRRIIQIGQSGVHDPAQISELAIKQLGFHKRLGSGFEQQSPCERLGGSSRSALMPEISNCD